MSYYKIEDTVELAKEFQEKMKDLSDFEALQLAIQFQRTELHYEILQALENGFGIDEPTEPGEFIKLIKKGLSVKIS